MDWTDELIKTVIAVTAPVIAGYIVAWLHRAVRALGFTLSAERQAKAEAAALRAVIAAEEWAARRVRAGLAKPPGSAKAAQALKSLLRRVPGISDDEADELIDAALVKAGLGAAHALRRLREAAQS
jgi:hypothetical protein